MLFYVALAVLVAVASAQDPPVAPCKCGGFVSDDMGELMLYELPPLEAHNCDQSHYCQNRCFEEFDELSGGGDLEFITSDGVTPVGQLLCSAAGKEINAKFVYAYSNLCETNWEATGDMTMQPLCCDPQGSYFQCPPPPTPPPTA